MNDIQEERREDLRPDAPVIRDIKDLGGRAALYLLSLIQANHLHQRVTPTQDATITLLRFLDALGVVRAEQNLTPVSNVTLGDKLPWSYTWAFVEEDRLQERLTEYLTNLSQSTLYADTWLRIWKEIIPGEVVAYLQHQLRIHRFSDVLLAELAPLFVQNESRYSLGQWRYACWASVRSMASVSLQYPDNLDLLKFTLANELPRRLQIASGSAGDRFSFGPAHSIPACALTNVFSNVATHLADTFWRSAPAIELI